jgi:hypothetical protein
VPVGPLERPRKREADVESWLVELAELLELKELVVIEFVGLEDGVIEVRL